jgi:outer membrane immunogenic protein
MQMLKNSLAGLVASVAMTAVTLGISAQESRAEHAPTHDWTGPYIGALIGIGSFEADARVYDGASSSGCSGGCALPTYPLNDSGFMGGLSVGWNAQDGHIAYGIVGDLMLGDISETLTEGASQASPGFDSLTVQTDLFATVRGRVGVAADYIFLYGTAGLAILDGDVTVNGLKDDSDSKGFTALGPVVGAGAELAINENVSFQAELLYAFFDESVGLGGINVCCQKFRDSEKVKIENFYSVRFGVNWHF